MFPQHQIEIVIDDDHPVLGVSAMLSLVSPHPETDFNEILLVRLLRSSICLTMDEKVRLLKRVPQFSQSQVDTLIAKLCEEREKFEFLAEEFPSAVEELVQSRQAEIDEAVVSCELIKTSSVLVINTSRSDRSNGKCPSD